MKNATVGAPVLGLYGTTGRGKSTLSKALCDYFSAEFSSRVCHVELLSERSRMRRQRLMLKNLCGIERDVLDRITDDRQVLQFFVSTEHLQIILHNGFLLHVQVI